MMVYSDEGCYHGQDDGDHIIPWVRIRYEQEDKLKDVTHITTPYVSRSASWKVSSSR